MYRRNIKLLSIFNFLIGFSLFAPLAILYFAKVSGSYVLGTSVFGIIMISAAVFEIPTGVWSDKVGRKYTVVLGTWSGLIAYVLYALGFSYAWIVAGAIFEGLSRAFYSGNNDALLYDTLAENNKLGDFEEYQGKVSATEQLAMGTSAILSGLVVFLSYQPLLWIAVLMQTGMLVISYLLVEPKKSKGVDTNVFAHVKEAIKLFIHNKKLRLLSIASILSYSISELKWLFGSAFVATVWPAWAIGLSKTLPSFGASLSFYFSGKLIRKFKAIRVLIFDSLYGKLISLVALAYPTPLSPILTSSSSFLYGVSEVSKKTLMQHEFSDHQRATMSSLNSLGGSIGFALMSVFLGSLADSFGPAKGMLILTIISLPVVYIYWVIFKNDSQLQVTTKPN